MCPRFFRMQLTLLVTYKNNIFYNIFYFFLNYYYF
jgi:hypothetical protein